jgi:NDP-4-keto-2,6-dideoxyhexose 3-C-methyltransferase
LPKHHKIDRCRICANPNLAPILNLGQQYLTGVFPRDRNQKVSSGPLELVRCTGPDACGLVQLHHSYDQTEMYGSNYGYRSSLNASMVQHLADKVRVLCESVSVGKSDLVIDIGSNDGTLLSNFSSGGATLVGIDPTANKFRHFYRPDIHVIADFFSADIIRERFPGRRAKLVTSIAMFYDLEAPQEFARQIAGLLAEDGIWHFEQSYLPTMLEATAYDTICHEHLEYYALRQIKWIADRADLKIVDVAFNSVNGGSFAVSVSPRAAPYPEFGNVDEILRRESERGINTPETYVIFAARAWEHRAHLLETIRALNASGKKVFGYGASTKGNVLLQFCGLGPAEIPCIAEVNPDKFGCITPGTWIPIVSEMEAKAAQPDYLLVLPWHFRDNLIAREQAFLQNGGKMIFPLPILEVVALR